MTKTMIMTETITKYIKWLVSYVTMMTSLVICQQSLAIRVTQQKNVMPSFFYLLPQMVGSLRCEEAAWLLLTLLTLLYHAIFLLPSPSDGCITEMRRGSLVASHPSPALHLTAGSSSEHHNRGGIWTFDILSWPRCALYRKPGRMVLEQRSKS